MGFMTVKSTVLWVSNTLLRLGNKKDGLQKGCKKHSTSANSMWLKSFLRLKGVNGRNLVLTSRTNKASAWEKTPNLSRN